jgi:hypothetical protein
MFTRYSRGRGARAKIQKRRKNRRTSKKNMRSIKQGIRNKKSSTVGGLKLCVPGPLKVKGKGIREVGVAADK